MTKKHTIKFQAPTKICRIFISRKTSDKGVAEMRREKLRKWAPGRLEFFDAAQIEPGAKWRDTIREELSRANIFFLVLTKPARDEFDWPLYEAGLFESLVEEDRRRIVCIYADSMEGPPDQLQDIQGVQATEDEILDLLLKLFHNKDFSLTEEPLNTVLEDGDLRPIAREIADDISGVESADLKYVRFANDYIQLHLPRGATSLEPSVEVESSERSLGQIFDADRIPPQGEHWTWGELSKRAASIIPREKDPCGFNQKWMQQLEAGIAAIRSGDKIRQLNGRFLATNGKLYRPEIEAFRVYENGRLTIDVTFSEQVQDFWLRNARPPVALAANLALASRVRHELIEPYVRRVPRWRSETAMEDGCVELSRLVEDIEHDGYFIAQLTRYQLEEAFDEMESDELGELKHEYRTKIRPDLDKALEGREIPSLRQALKEWKDNNLRFLDIGLKRYAKMLGLPRAPTPREAPAVQVPAA